MIKNYLSQIFLALLFCSSLANAQTVVANDDTAIINGNTGGYLSSIRQNDVINGVMGSQANCNTSVYTLLSTTHPGFSFDNTCGSVLVAPGIPAGTYTLVYQVCLAASPNVCDMATVTVNVCNQLPPVIQSIIPAGCGSATASVVLTGMPETGDWELMVRGWNYTNLITGNGATTTLTLSPGSYTAVVTNSTGCQATALNIYIPYPTYYDTDFLTSYQDVDANGIPSVGDIVHFIASITNMLDCTISNITIVDGNGLTNMAGQIAQLPAGTTNNTSLSGVHVITQEDINNGTFQVWMGVNGTYENNPNAYTKIFKDFSLSIANGIQLVAFVDDNGNGIQDVNESNFNGGEFLYTINSGEIRHLYAGQGTAVLYETNPLNVYNLSYDVVNQACSNSYTVNTQGYNNITVPNLSGITTYSFPLTIVPCTDAGVYVYGQNPVPGMPYFNNITLYNFGNQAIASGTVTYTKDADMSIASISSPYAQINPTGFTYNFINLLPGETRIITVNLVAPVIPVITLGDISTVTASVTTSQADSNEANNTDSFSSVIAGAYDPNDKAESHGGKINIDSFEPGDYLTYTIRFENTGNGNASNIVITDELEDGLNEASAKVVASSHPNYTMERVGNILSFKFNNINLPPSVSPETTTGKGFIVFQVMPNAGYAVGDIIENNAAIFFDTNPLIRTNTTQTEFVATLNTDHFAAGSITAYPNPVKSELNIKADTALTKVEVYNVLGQLALSQNASGTVANMNMSVLKPGIYLVRIHSDKNISTVQIIKE